MILSISNLAKVRGSIEMRVFRNFAIASLFAATTACASVEQVPFGIADHEPQSEASVGTLLSLRELPAPRERISVAVYGFEDQTGQFKPAEKVQTLSKAVSQGSTSVLVKALQDAGQRSWFTVIERENLDNLLKERQIIREMRRQYLGEENVNGDALPPLLFAGVLLEGGIIGYDTNTRTGGAGARFLGIGAKADYREDKVTVYLRAVSVKNGEVITSVVASKKIASVGVAGNAFRFVSFKELLEVDTGFTTNEPDLLALRQAIEKAVELLVLEGADLGVWDFEDQVAGAEVLDRYRLQRDGEISVADIERGERVVEAEPEAQPASNQKLSSNTQRNTATERSVRVDTSSKAPATEQSVRRVNANIGGTMGTVQKVNLVARDLSETTVTKAKRHVTCHRGSTSSTADPHIAVDAAAVTGGDGEPTHEACPVAALSNQMGDTPPNRDQKLEAANVEANENSQKDETKARFVKTTSRQITANERHRIAAIERATQEKQVLRKAQLSQVRNAENTEKREG